MPHAARQPRSWLIFDVRQKMTRKLSPEVKNAVAKLFPGHAAGVEERLLRASIFDRAHKDILAFSLGDREKLEELCVHCEDDVSGERNIYAMEDVPEEHFEGIARKDDAAAELARRFELLAFPVPRRFSTWGQYSKQWKSEWSRSTTE